MNFALHTTRVRRWLMLMTLLGVVGCSEDEALPVEQPVRCNTSESCIEPLVCRDRVCGEAPQCESIADCELGENCTDAGVCAYDETICTADSACDEGAICVDGACREGCRANRDCAETDRCTTDLVCERRPCTDLPCDEGYDCLEDSGLCELRPCNGGCEAPLQCRESDDQCVSCLAAEECDLGQSCTLEGICAEDPCESHEECVEGTYCIANLCQLPLPCDDDSLEANDTYDDGNLLSEGTIPDLVACPFNDDFYKLVSDANRSITVAIDTALEGPALDVEIFNTVGVLFGRRQNILGADSVTVNVGKTGVYTVRVAQSESAFDGAPYELSLATAAEVEVAPDLCVADTFEPNDAPDDATVIFTGRWTGMSVCDGDADYYRIRAEGGELLRVCVAPDDARGVSLGLEVLRSSGEVLLSDAGREPFCVEDDLLQGDDYRAYVFAAADGEETPYHVTFQIEEGCRLYEDDLDVRDQNDTLPFGDDPPLEVVPESALPAEFRICPNDSDYFPIPMVEGDRLTASIDFVHEDGNLDLRLHGPGGNVLLGSSGIGDREVLEHSVRRFEDGTYEEGTYHLRVYGFGRAMGAYTLDYTVERD